MSGNERVSKLRVNRVGSGLRHSKTVSSTDPEQTA